MNCANYFVFAKNSRLVDGHFNGETLYQRILDHDGTEAYHCAFNLEENLLKIEYFTGELDKEGKRIYQYVMRGQKPKRPDYKCNGPSFAKYEGTASPALGMVSFDFDDEENPENSLNDVRKFVEWLGVNDLVIFFSGNKGFHVMVPFGYFGLEEGEHLPNQLKDLAKYFKEFYPTMDTSVYNYNRKFRVPFSLHPTTNLYKNKISQIDLEKSIDEIKNLCVERKVEFFIFDDPFERDTLDIIEEAIEESKRVSYEIEKDRAGSLSKPSPFESFDGKVCIKKMLDNRCDGNRNNAALRIVNDYYRTGKPREKAEADLQKWSLGNGLAWTEVSNIIGNIYDHGHNYNFGCQDELKSEFCSAKCSIWKKLDPEKRPVTVDMPTSAGSSSISVFEGVTWLFTNAFNVGYDEETKEFDFSETTILKQNGEDLFYYKDKHWQYIDRAKIQKIKTIVNDNHQKKLGIKKLDEIFKLFTMYVPEVPEGVDLFSPKRDLANFLDGTLHLERDGGKFKLVFQDHVKKDYCTTIVPLKYQDYLDNKNMKNKAFEEWLLKYLLNDQESFALIQEMFGASLMPKFPQFFILLGLSGTGKSTTIKILKQLHQNDKNISGVSPDAFNGFNMSSMIGKLMNIVGDIKTNCTISDDIVKQVDDQEPVRISIKGKEDVYTTLPALHIFGANKMPKTNEGYSGAMGRRFSIVNFNKKFQGKKNAEIARDLFAQNPQGVLNFAIKGLERLVIENGGEYTKTEGKERELNKWLKSSDYLHFFLSDLAEEYLDVYGESIKLEVSSDKEIKRPDIWAIFNKWQKTGIEQKNQLGKMTFYNLLNDSGFKSSRRSDGFFYEGIGKVTFTEEKSI